MTQYEEERQHCKEIADTLEAYANGDMWRDEEGEEVNLNDLTEEEREAVMEQGEELSLYDCFDEVFDIEYRVGSDGAYRSVQLMVACGGPNIYIDTASGRVELYWWGDKADYPIDRDTIEAIDQLWEEYYEMTK